MRKLLTLLALLWLAGGTRADRVAPKAPKAPKLKAGVWKPLVQPNQKWLLKNNVEKDGGEITVETYDVRKVGDADVARLRWTFSKGKDKSPVDQGAPTQIAVGKTGAWFLNAADDDTAVAKALKKKPDYADPPALWKPMTRKDGRSVMQEERNGKWMVCVEDGPAPGAGECDDVCFANVCFADEGIVELGGTWAPNYEPFIAEGWHD